MSLAPQALTTPASAVTLVHLAFLALRALTTPVTSAVIPAHLAWPALRALTTPKMAVHQSMIAVPALPGSSILRLGLHLVFCAQRVKSPFPVHPLVVDALLDPMPLLLEKQIVLFARQGITVTLLEQTRPTRVLRV